MVNFKSTLMISMITIAILLFGCKRHDKMNVAGIDLTNLDATIKPVSNFYLYANGGWLRKYSMPSEYSRYGAFDKLQEDNDILIHNLVETLSKQNNQEGSVAQKIADFYLSGMDSVQIEKEGITPLKPEFEKILTAKSIEDIQQLVGYYHTMNIRPLFDFSGEPDSKNSEMMISDLSQGGLGLGQRDYYVDTTKNSINIRTEYVKHIHKMYTLAGFGKQSEPWSKKVMDIETRLAKASKTKLELRDPIGNYHKIKFADVQMLVPNINWESYFKTIGLSDPGDINVGQPEFFKEVNNMMKDISVEDWKAYLIWTLINQTSPYLSSEFVNEHFNFYDKFRPAVRPFILAGAGYWLPVIKSWEKPSAKCMLKNIFHLQLKNGC